jgi:hypothetical protein
MDGNQKLTGCNDCRMIVVRVYGELRAQGIDEESALRSALRVFSLRHPECKAEDIAGVASAWLFGEQGP